MFRSDERQLAARLARVLAGEERPDGEVGALATLLEQAADTARFRVPEDTVEVRLARVRPRARPVGENGAARRGGVPRLVFAFAAAGAAAVALLLFTFLRLPGVDVEGKALAALGGPETVLRIEERIEPAVPGLFPSSTRVVWLDSAHGLERWSQRVHGQRIEDVLVEQGRVSRLLREQRLLIVAGSCKALASGCAELVDPVAFYRRALTSGGTVKAKREHGTYRLTLPVQALPDAVHIEQRVTIDAATYLPKQIEWVETPRSGGPARTVSRIVIESVRKLPSHSIVWPFELPRVAGVRIEHRTGGAAPLRMLGERRLSLAAARRLRPPLLWLGPEHEFRKVTEIDEVRWNAGRAYRIRYASITLWNFTNVVPPGLTADRYAAPPKPFPVDGNIAHFYEAAGGRVVAELDRPGRSVALVAPTYTKEDVVRALEQLRPLR